MRFVSIFLTGFMLLLAASVSAQPPGATVIVAEVVTEVVDDVIEAHGTLKAREAVTISATVTDLIREIHFEDGAQVEQGALLLSLDDREEQARLRVKQAQLVERENELNRARQLLERNLGSRAEVEDNQARLAETRAEVEEIQVRLQRYLIKAPFSGVVGLRDVSPGMLVSPGTELVRLVAVDPINLDFTVPELFLADLKPGLNITARSRSYPDEVFLGQIEALQSEIDPQTRSITVRASLENPDFRLRPGQFMQVDIARGERQVLALPESALIPEGNRQFVFVVSEDGLTVSRKQVEIGIRYQGRVEISAGLEAGEKVVVHGVQKLRDGAGVQILGMVDEQRSIRDILQQNREQSDDAR